MADQTEVPQQAAAAEQAEAAHQGEAAQPARVRDLEVDGLRKRFGGHVAVDGVSFTVPAGTLLGLIGPNGSGKTTTLNLVNGVHRPDAGAVRVGGVDLTGRRPATLVRHGVTRTFQTPHVFHTITALENMLVPVLHHRGGRAAFQDRALELLEFVGLAGHRDTPASELSGGQQKLLEFVRALMTEPAVVLMDEPFAGVHPAVKELMRQRIVEVNARGTSFIIVSHEIPDLTRLCRQVICMSEGRVIAEGPPAEVTADRRVVEAYLGRGAAATGREAGT
ncbi:MAG TPA: ABC transporter ATP-binding protein [Natronosporangium sp.]|nr:ABC transporter ATP-binding protein [Natronosporangium sp.]